MARGLVTRRTYAGYRRAGVRLGEPLDPEVAAGIPEFERVGALGPGIHLFDLAQVVVLAEARVVTRRMARAMRDALRALEPDITGSRDRVGGGLHSGERYLVRQLGLTLGGRLHTGRSSWDVEATAMRLTLREGLLGVLGDLLRWRQALLHVAGRHLRTVMPYFTHGQIAGTTTLAHALHAQEVAAARHTTRLLDLYRRVNASPAGSAAGAGAPFRLSRGRVAALLGFDDVLGNTLDAVRSTDAPLEALAALAMLAQSLAGFGDDLVLWSGDRLQYVRLADRHCHTSSVLPHKRNPEGAMQLQGAGRFAAARLVGRMSGDVWPVIERVRHALHLAVKVIEGLHPNLARMREDARESWAQAPMLAAALVQHTGLSWREAHQVVAFAVRTSEARGGTAPGEQLLADLRSGTRHLMDRDLVVTGDVVWRALDPDAAVAACDGVGGPAPHTMKKALLASRRLLRRDRVDVGRCRQRTARGAARLQRALGAL